MIATVRDLMAHHSLIQQAKKTKSFLDLLDEDAEIDIPFTIDPAEYDPSEVIYPGNVNPLGLPNRLREPFLKFTSVLCRLEEDVRRNNASVASA